MRRTNLPILRISVLVFAAAVIAAPAFASPAASSRHGNPHANPPGAAGDHPNGHEHGSSGSSAAVTTGSYFTAQQRAFVQGYYSGQFHAGRCPPGLAKKHDGCMPPGLAKQWQIGQPLPGSVAPYPLPQPVLSGLGPPPPGYRYERVVNDILLIATGTRMVVDAIQNLGQ